MPQRTALLSVFHKDGIVEFARELLELDFSLFASGGTARTLAETGIPVRDVAELVGGGSILGHRVVTLSREVHAGLLARDIPEDRAELERLGIPFIDLVCVDLYPLAEEIARHGATPESVIEKTDIGGPTLLSSGAKGRRIVIADPADRMRVVTWLRAGEPDRDAMITRLAAKADGIVANYRLASARFHSGGEIDGMIGGNVRNCKYGENPWQTPAALFSSGGDDPLALERFVEIAGTDPSYVNLTDLDRLLQTMTHIAAGFDLHHGYVPCIAIGCKHGNPCGAAISYMDRNEALEHMVEGNPEELFGGLVMTNFAVDAEMAGILRHYAVPPGSMRALDGVIAPAFTPDAVPVFHRKEDKCRIFENRALASFKAQSLDASPRFRQVRGGFLRQPNYTNILNLNAPEIETIGRNPTKNEKDDLLLAWAIGQTSNSNTVTIVKNRMLIGNGVGQRSRVGCCRLAVELAKKAGHDLEGAVAYSDSFFPFQDGPAVLAGAGVKVIFSSSGSIRDSATKTLCQERGVTLLLIPDKLGRGFFSH